MTVTKVTVIMAVPTTCTAVPMVTAVVVMASLYNGYRYGCSYDWSYDYYYHGYGWSYNCYHGYCYGCPTTVTMVTIIAVPMTTSHSILTHMIHTDTIELKRIFQLTKHFQNHYII